MLDIFLKFAGWIRAFAYWGSKPHESKYFSRSFNFRKWLIFISLLFFIFSSLFLLFKLFEISAQYLDLQSKYKIDKSVIAKKKLILNGDLKALEGTELRDDKDNKILLNIYELLMTNATYNRKNTILFSDLQALLNENQTLLTENYKVMKMVQIQLLKKSERK